MTVRRISVFVVVIIGVLCGRALGQDGTTNGEWRSYAGDVWGTKYAALDQITGRKIPSVDRLYSSDDQLEGARAFAEKRKPLWRGR